MPHCEAAKLRGSDFHENVSGISPPSRVVRGALVTGQRGVVVVGDTDAGRRRILARRTGTMPAAMPSPCAGMLP